MAGLCALLLAAPPAAARPSLKLSRTAAHPGVRVVVAGHGFPRSAALRLSLGGRTLRRARTGPRGGFRLAFRVPDRGAGAYRIRVFVRGRRVRRRFRIRAVPLPPGLDPARAPAQAQPAAAPAPPAPEVPTLVAAGDISCRPNLPETPSICRDAHTASLVESLAPDAVAALGDLQYEGGEPENFTLAYDPTWGRFKAITHPAPGNHEYEGDPERDAAPGYFGYFGATAGDPSKGYYRWSLGDWTMFVLNSGAINYTRVRPELPDDCWPVSCMVGSGQEQWLRAELATLPAASCVLAYWHHPRFSSGFSGQNQPHPETEPLYDALYDHDADLILTGHSHNYERFEPLAPGGTADPDGVPDPNGVTQFVVGTGGRSLHMPGPQLATSEILHADVFGVLELTLASDGWSSRFIAEDGSSVDQAAGGC